MRIVVSLVFGIVFGCGVHLMTRRNALKIVFGSLLLTNAAVLLLMSVSFERGYGAALVDTTAPAEMSDPLVQAFVLTAIVIGFGVSVFLLRLTLELERTHDTLDLRAVADIEARDEESQDEEHAP